MSIEHHVRAGWMGDGAAAPPEAGVLYLALGEGHAALTAQSIAFLRRHGYEGPVRVVTDIDPWDDADVEFVQVPPAEGRWGSRRYKTRLDRFAFPTTLFLDSDTLPIGSIDPLWDELRWGDLCLAYDIQPTVREYLDENWGRPNRSPEEMRLMRGPGFNELGYYNSGVILWRQTDETRRLFEAWSGEWERFRSVDQMALARAIKATDIDVRPLSPIWNCLPRRFGTIATAQRSGVRVLHFLSRQRHLMSSYVDGYDSDGGRGSAPRAAPPAPPGPAAADRMRVLWITGTMHPRVGGIQTYVEKTTAGLSERCEVGLVTRYGQWPTDGAPIAHFSLSAPGAGNQTEAWRSMAGSLRDVIDRFEPDIVHFAQARSASCRAIVPEDIATVATVHGNDLTNLRPEHAEEDPTAYVVESLNACDRVLTCSDHTSAVAGEWGVTAPLQALTHGCDLDFYRPWPALGAAARRGLGIGPGDPVVLTVSRLVQRKGHLTVLEALSSLPFRAWWVVVGAGPCAQEIMEAAVEHRVADRVLMLGAVPDDELLGLYNACDLFVLTPESQRIGRWLDSEGFGLVLHEAGACRKPVIASAAAGCQDAVIDGGTGLLVPPGDPARLAEAMAAILTDRRLARALGEGGLSLVRMSGGWPRLAQQILEIYQDLLAGRDLALAPGSGAASARAD